MLAVQLPGRKVTSFSRIRFHLSVLHITLADRKESIARTHMLEIAAIIFLVLTIPFWLPLAAGIVTSLISFGFMAAFWLIFIFVVLYLILT